MEDDRAATNLGPDVDQGIVEESPSVPKQPKRRFVGRKTAEKRAGSHWIPMPTSRTRARYKNINDAIALLPPNYNFEIHKCIHRIRTSGAKSIALQFPEGLLLFATTISDILTRFCPGTSTLIMGDVTYGACCIDDYTARALGCDLLIHYAHSCLIPVAVTKIATLYIFVSITIDTQHLINTITDNFAGIPPVCAADCTLVQREILGCTSPSMAMKAGELDSRGREQQVPDLILYLGDGRFHLESAMIANPQLPAYRYDPYSQRLTHEVYEHDLRRSAILTARKARTWGIILGSLGRQGNPHTLTLIEKELSKQNIKCISLLMSEIFPGKLAMMGDVEAWVQIACPRLSIDWDMLFLGRC
ncbi:diphthamide biosynthesis protein 1 [Bipolaris maydis]|nr:diphthamide biosynthesis protein 1 [Bipolaris maydis]